MEEAQHSFYFVNKHATSRSLSKSHGNARLEILRHARLSSLDQARSTRHRQNTLSRVSQRSASLRNEHKIPRNVALPSQPAKDKGVRSQHDAWRQETPLVLHHGNSDPFAALAIEVTPQINQLITFVRDTYLPGLYLTPFMRRFTRNCPRDPTLAQSYAVLGGPSAIRDWEQLKVELRSEFGGLAWVSSWIPAMIKFVKPIEASHWSLLALQMRARSFKALRTNLARVDEHKSQMPMVLLQVLWFFRAACVEGNTSSAIIHANMLCKLFEKVEDPVEQTQFLVVMMFNDTELAISKMQRTLIDLKSWVPCKMGAFWDFGVKYLPETSPDYQHLHPSIRCKAVREIAVRLRRCLAISQSPMDIRNPDDIRRGDLIYNWMATRTLCDMGMLINTHLELLETTPSRSVTGQQATEAAIALAVLHILRKSMHSAAINNVDVRDLSHVIIPALKSTLKIALDLSTLDEMRHYQQAYLWMFYLGAQIEHSALLSSCPDALTSSDSWFTKMFLEQAYILGMGNWPDIEGTLRMFIFNEFLGPDLSDWVGMRLTSHDAC